MVSERRTAFAILVALVGAAPAVALADEPLAITAPAPGPAPARVGRTFSQLIADRITELGDTLDGHLAPLTFDALNLRFDGRAQRARLRLGAETRYLSLHITSDVHFTHGVADVDAAIDLGIAGTKLRIELPDFELVPRSYLGERYVEVRVPLLRRSF